MISAPRPAGPGPGCAPAAATAAAAAAQPCASPTCVAAPAVVGVLKGYDQLMNLVLDEAVEYLRGELQPWLRMAAWHFWAALFALQRWALRTSLCACICPSNLLFAYSLLRVFNPLPVPPADPEDPMRVTDQTRPLGLIVCRGTSVMLVVPTAGTEEIANPFQQAEGMEA